MSEYTDMTVAELKELLKDAGLPVSGKKADPVSYTHLTLPPICSV